MWQNSGARPRGGGRARLASTLSGRTQGRPDFTPVVLTVQKRGAWQCIAKLVVAHPLGEVVLAMPYRHRQSVEHVSLPPAALNFARAHGATAWVVRLDLQGECYALPLADVERVGWLHPSDGRPEWFVPIAKFEPMPWQSWAFVERTIRLGLEPPEQPPAAPAAPCQLALFGGEGA